MFGHSMGGLITLRCVLRNRSFFNGLILEGPLIQPTSKPSFVMNQIAKVANAVAPDYVYLALDLNDVSKDQVRSWVDCVKLTSSWVRAPNRERRMASN